MKRLICFIVLQTMVKCSGASRTPKCFTLHMCVLHYANLCETVFISCHVGGLFTLKLLTGEQNALCCIFNLYSNIHLAVFHSIKSIPWKYHKIAVRYKNVELLSSGTEHKRAKHQHWRIRLPQNGKEPLWAFACHLKLKAVSAVR